MKTTTAILTGTLGFGALATIAFASVQFAPQSKSETPQIIVNANSSADERFTYTETNTHTTTQSKTQSVTETVENNVTQPAPTYNLGNSGSAPAAAVRFQMEIGGPLVDCTTCTVKSRINANGHKVYDVFEADGYTRTIVLWNDGSAEVFAGAKGKNKVRRGTSTWVRQGGHAVVTIVDKFTGSFSFAL